MNNSVLIAMFLLLMGGVILLYAHKIEIKCLLKAFVIRFLNRGKVVKIAYSADVNIKVELSPEAQGNGDQQDHGGQGAQEPLFGVTEPLGPQLALGIEQAQIDHHPGGVEKQNIHDRHDPNGRGKDLIFL